MKARETVGGHPAGPKLVSELTPPPAGPGPGMGTQSSQSSQSSQDRRTALNLGCGMDVRQSNETWEWVNLDIAPTGEGVIVHDLDQFPWPFEDGYFDAVLADDVWEHIEHPLEFMREVHRLLRVGGQVKIRTCQWGIENGYRDPTHKRWATPETFRYWTPGHWLNEKYPHYASGAHFKQVEVRAEGDNYVFVLEKL